MFNFKPFISNKPQGQREHSKDRIYTKMHIIDNSISTDISRAKTPFFNRQVKSFVESNNQFHCSNSYNTKWFLLARVRHNPSAPTLSSCSLRRRWISLTTVSFCLSECSGSSKISFLHSSIASFSCSMSDATSEPWNGYKNIGTREGSACIWNGLRCINNYSNKHTHKHTAKKNTLTIGLEKWSSARPRSMVRSELLFLFPKNSSGLAS